MQNRALSEDKHLTVFRASAGSGKTHRLTGEFLRLLFASPAAYRRILAVTFTNKATDEMKSRIIEELSNLATGKKSDYLNALMREQNKGEEQIREQARKTLVNILHDYSSFSISTIDRFFQQTMRAFTREIGISGGYNVELDSDKVLREAIDSMLSDLERKDNKRLLEWLLRFSEEKIESGGAWNIRNDIHSLSSEIFKESYKAFSDKLQQAFADKDFMDDYKKMLGTYIRNFEKTSQQFGEQGLNIMVRFGLQPEDFKGGSRSPFVQFRKWANGEIKEPTATFMKLPDTPENWVTAKTDAATRSSIERSFDDGLNRCVGGVVAHYQNSRLYQTAYEINRYYFTLGILSDVDRKIREYTAENNLMLLSDTTELLNKLIDGTDTPFIYEKTGTYIDHYMIDEFQDTSGMQWKNFYPLIKDSIAAGRGNLIVGDVKQSIYRWRNSDWKLLEEQLDKDFGAENIAHKSLDTNWRSLANIINFNNAVFAASARLLQAEFNETLPKTEDERLNRFAAMLETAYSGIYQHIPASKKEKEGHVRMEFIDAKEYPDWQSRSLELLPQKLEELQDKGYRLKDIAILVRTKKEGEAVANCLLEYKGAHPEGAYRYDIISDEALFVRNAQSVKLAVSLLKYLWNPTDATLHSLAVYEYYKTQEQLPETDAIQKHLSLTEDFPEEISRKLEAFAQLPLYEMLESIFDLFRNAMNSRENVYIQAFLDMALDFTVKQTSDLDAFLQWWEETGSEKTVFTPDEQDAVRIMTIHKSKGLGFDAVLLPFAQWDIDHNTAMSTILWCKPNVEPFNRLGLAPVKYSKKLRNTIFDYEYYEERLHAFIDNLNILYVAFTRAKKELFVCLPKPSDKKRETIDISLLLWAALHTTLPANDNESYIHLPDSLDEASGVFELGGNYAPSPVPPVPAQQELYIELLPSVPFDNRLKLKLNNKYAFSDNGRREYGTLMHEIISKVQTAGDLDGVLDAYCISGDITAAEKPDIYKVLFGFLTKEETSAWYSGDFRVLNEVEILQPDGRISRPDRVMLKDGEVTVIDYKFGEKEDLRYIRQVKFYMSRIAQMGYSQVNGYVCYVSLNKIEPVVRQ
ncbi:MAG: UvrD-helicase domain-containing protein [Prevotella sp.]|jgi:ATP-dependent exoDNAse (exonuclease V) beta subunit|nr:UvrD-helicase domain-containing protein [Prevotella sp.]